MVVEMLLFGEDGDLIRGIPDTEHGFPSHSQYILHRGEVFTISVDSFFVKDNITRVDGMIEKITFDDGSTWPPMPATPPGKHGSDPVSIRMIGYEASDNLSEAVVACFNYASKPVRGMLYRIKYLDGTGNELKTDSMIHDGDAKTPVLRVGEGKVLTGPDGPPKGATAALARVIKVIFTDGTKWEPSY